MSLRPGLLASTSRAALVLARPAPRAFSTTPRRADKEGTVQNIDKELKNRERMLASMPRGIDITSHFESVILGTSGITAAPHGTRVRSLILSLWPHATLVAVAAGAPRLLLGRAADTRTHRRPTNVGQAPLAPQARPVLPLRQGALPARRRHCTAVRLPPRLT